MYARGMGAMGVMGEGGRLSEVWKERASLYGRDGSIIIAT